MRRSLAIFVLVCLSLVGCRLGGKRDLLERDLRLQEDRIYELEDGFDQCEAQLECSRRENEALKKDGGGEGTGTSGSLSTPAVELPPGISTPSRPSRRSREAPRLEPPVIELEPGSPGQPGLRQMPPPGRTPGFDSSSLPHGKPTKIVLNPRLTGGLNQDGRPGDEGIMVAFEPRDAQGRLAAVPGDVSIVVLDPTQQGAAARVARWDFTADEALTHFHKGLFGSGLQFQLPWPGNPPANKDLHLFVRYSTPDGEKLAADVRISVEPLSLASTDGARSAWTAAVPRAPRPPITPRPTRVATRPFAATLASDTQPIAPDAAFQSLPDESVQREEITDSRTTARSEKPTWKPYR